MRGRLEVHQIAHQCAVHAGMVTDKLMACYEGERIGVYS
jgi:hypothetical protein